MSQPPLPKVLSQGVTRRTFARLGLGAAAAAAPLGLRAFADVANVADVADAAPRTAAAADVVRAHGSSLLGDLKYAPDFTHFDYLNPNAPKGGEVRIRERGGPFDSFNPFVVRGRAPLRILAHCYDALTSGSAEEGSTQYGLLAEWLEHPADYSWVRYKLRPEAAWSDGTPLTAADIIFSMDILKANRAFYALYYKNVVEMADLGDGVVEFRFDQTGNRELPQIVGQLPALPKHYWEERPFDATLEKPVVSGPYDIGAFEAGRFVEFVRRSDYWGAELPINQGLHNFDRVRYIVYGDNDAALQAFQAGDVYFRAENSARNWATRYDFPAVQDGRVRQVEPRFEGPKTIQGFAFNLRREKFQHRLTRRAIAQAFDFAWLNKQVFYEQYAQPVSYFQGTPSLMATGLPESRELEILEAYRGQIPDEVFTTPYQPPQSDGSGRDRRALRRAVGWLLEAGWRRDRATGRMVDANGAPFVIDFIIFNNSGQDRVITPLRDTLRLIGVTLNVVSLEAVTMQRRAQTYDYDMMIDGIANSESPGNEQREYWGSAAADQERGRNAVGLKNPVVDALIEDLILAHDRAELEAYSKALDRVLLWGFYHIMELYTPYERLAYWTDKVAPPPWAADYAANPDQTLSARLDLFPSAWWSVDATGVAADAPESEG